MTNLKQTLTLEGKEIKRVYVSGLSDIHKSKNPRIKTSKLEDYKATIKYLEDYGFTVVNDSLLKDKSLVENEPSTVVLTKHAQALEEELSHIHQLSEEIRDSRKGLGIDATVHYTTNITWIKDFVLEDVYNAEFIYLPRLDVSAIRSGGYSYPDIYATPNNTNPRNEWGNVIASSNLTSVYKVDVENNLVQNVTLKYVGTSSDMETLFNNDLDMYKKHSDTKSTLYVMVLMGYSSFLLYGLLDTNNHIDFIGGQLEQSLKIRINDSLEYYAEDDYKLTEEEAMKVVFNF